MTNESFVRGLEEATRRRLPVANVSFAGGGFRPEEQDVVNAAGQVGTAVVAAAGNCSEQHRMFPGAYHGVANVGGTDAQRPLSRWMQPGNDDCSTSGSANGEYVDMAAPAEGIYVADFNTEADNADVIATRAGTSHAAPQVTAVVGLLHSLGMPPIRALHRALSAGTPLVQDEEEPFDLGLGRLDAGAALTNDVVRLAGKTRIGTAVEISREVFPGDPNLNSANPGASPLLPQAVILATSHGPTIDQGFADSLAAAGLAGTVDAPILLVPRIPPLTPEQRAGTQQFEDPFRHGDDPVRAEIDRLLGCPVQEGLPDGVRIYIAGGVNSVSDAYYWSLVLGPCFDEQHVQRFDGVHRYETAAQMAEAVVAGRSSFDVFLATGVTFPDALAASPRAAATRTPTLLTPPDLDSDGTLTDSVEEFLQLHSGRIQRLHVLGGPNSVSEAIVTRIRQQFGITVDRIAGANRYETASQFARQFFTNPNSAVIATGQNWPDAVTAGSLGTLAPASGLPLLLTTSNTSTLHASTSTYLSDHGSLNTVYMTGGRGTIDHDAFLKAETLVN